MIFADYSPWKELVDASYNVLVDDCPDEIFEAFVDKVGQVIDKVENFYGGGNARQIIVDSIVDYLREIKSC